MGELKWMESSTNVLFDSTLKNLKVLKDMIWSLAKKLNNDEAVVRELQLAGFAFNRTYYICCLNLHLQFANQSFFII